MVDSLARRPFFGALVDSDGAVGEVWPGSPADCVGLRPGDRVVSIDGVGARTLEQVRERLLRRRPGEIATLVLSHGGELRIGPLVIVPRPTESIEGAQAVYSQVTVDGIGQRTILVRPIGVKQPPVVVLLSGLATDSIDLFPPRSCPLAELVGGLARAGIASLRLEKRGVGDSEGGPAEDVDFETERAACAAAIEAIAQHPELDGESIVIFGHSMGGMLAPLVVGPRVRGVIAYGTWAGRFTAAMLASMERQRPAESGAANQLDAALLRAVVEGEVTIEDALAADPALAQAPALDGDGRIYGRTVQYFRQLERHDLLQAWRAAAVPTLLLHGSLDAITTIDDHAAIARVLAGIEVTAKVAELAGFAHDMTGPDKSLVHETIAFVHSVCDPG